MTGFDGWDWPAADAGRMTETMFDENARLRGLDPRHKDDGTVALTAGGRTVEARPDGHGGWNIPAEDPDDPDACLCSMVLRPVERLVFSPKER